MIWFTADSHFSHSNILRYCARPFPTIEEHDKTLIDNWNALVKPADMVYVLGDFCWNAEYALRLSKQLNGNKVFILGNHDSFNREFRTQWTVKDVLLISPKLIDGVSVDKQIWLSHYAHRVWPQSHYGSFHLHGHSHGSLPDDPNSLSFDVGVDANGFKPISLLEVQARMAKKTFIPIVRSER